MSMGAPHIVFGFRPTVLVGLLLAVVLAWLFWQVIVPRQLQGLRVAFPTAEKRYEVDASGQRALYEAKNVLDSEVISMEIKKLLIENLPSIIAQSVKPMEQIDGIKIIQVDGLSPNGGDGVKSAAAVGADSGSLADQLVNSALRYRGQAPLVDALMSEVGLKGGELNGLTNGLDASNGVEAIDHGQNGSGSAPAAHESVGD